MKSRAGVLTAGLLAVCLLGAPARAVTPEDAKSFMDDIAARGMIALQSRDKPIERFSRLILNGVDFVSISKMALGRVARRVEPRKLQQIGKLLAALVVNVAAERLQASEVSGFVVGGVRVLPNKDVEIHADIRMTSGKPLKTAWRINDRRGELKIVDVKIDGYSLRIHYRNMFARKLKYDGIDGLILILRKRTQGTPGMAWVQEAVLR